MVPSPGNKFRPVELSLDAVTGSFGVSGGASGNPRRYELLISNGGAFNYCGRTSREVPSADDMRDQEHAQPPGEAPQGVIDVFAARCSVPEC
jgi:hypothetical protein